MGRIHVLADKVANKIAAGEVVERPASVVKELLENSLDAGATRIVISVEGGGRKLIRVADDGCGMVRDDALLAFERHATSKLRSSDDLLSIATLGFRGEALPSIASIARLELVTRAAEEASGTRMEIAGGKLLLSKKRARPRAPRSVRDCSLTSRRAENFSNPNRPSCLTSPLWLRITRWPTRTSISSCTPPPMLCWSRPR